LDMEQYKPGQVREWQELQAVVDGISTAGSESGGGVCDMRTGSGITGSTDKDGG
jgi:hypothetical protein